MRLAELETNKIAEAIQYHIKNNIPFRENIFRPGTDNFFKLFCEARKMYEAGLLTVDWEDQELFETEIGKVLKTTQGNIALDLPFEEIEEADQVKGKEPMPSKSKPTTSNSTPHPYRGRLVGENKNTWYKDGVEMCSKECCGAPVKDCTCGPDCKHCDCYNKNKNINEAEYQGKKVELNKPKRGGSKKYYVYTRNPKTGKIKKVSWGDTTGLKTKANNPGAVKSFVARHDCKNKKDKTKAGYWACRTPRYKSLGVKGGQWW